MTEEIEKGKRELAETNNGTEQELPDSATGKPEALPGSKLLNNLPPEAREIIEFGMMSSFGPIR